MQKRRSRLTLRGLRRLEGQRRRGQDFEEMPVMQQERPLSNMQA